MSELHVVMYHYVRDLPSTAFPKLKALALDEFRQQIAALSSQFEMATLEAALAFLNGRYTPRRDLCLLTFDDGLRDHYLNVMPILAERRIAGLFGIITGCLEDGFVASVHMNHFLTAALEFQEYREALFRELEEYSPGLLRRLPVDVQEAQSSYPLDTPEMATFKLLVNFLLPPNARDAVLRRVFTNYFGDEAAFSSELYMNWDEVCQLQDAGMVLMGHTHTHQPVSQMTPAALLDEIHTNRRLLVSRTHQQHLWPFSFPYGKRNSYSPNSICCVRDAGFDCAFGTEPGHNLPDSPFYEISRIDCKGVLNQLMPNFRSVSVGA